MPISHYLKTIRDAVGSRILLVPAVAAIIRNECGEVLLHRRADDGEWSLPAGAIDPGESPATAVVREVHEETGLNIVPKAVLAAVGGAEFRHVYPNGDQVEYTVIVFDCEVIGGTP